MKTLVSLSALLAAALAALIFPEMKSTLLAIPFALLALAFTTGCSTSQVEKKLRALPDGHFDRVRLSNSNLGVGTTIEGEQLDKHNHEVKAGKLSAVHNDPWTGKTEMELINGTLDVSPETRGKKPAAPKPLNAESAEPAEKKS